MTSKQKQDLYNLAKRLITAANFYRRGGLEAPRFLADLDTIYKESLVIRQPAPTIASPEEKKTSGRELLSWAKDIRTQDFVQTKHINLDRKSQWHWIVEEKQVNGQINGLPKMHGIPRITNGIFVYLERADGSVVKAHYDWFIKHQNGTVATARKVVAGSKNDKVMKDILAYLDDVTV